MKAALTVVCAALLTPLFSAEIDFSDAVLQHLESMYDALRLLYILLALMLGTMWFLVMRSK